MAKKHKKGSSSQDKMLRRARILNDSDLQRSIDDAAMQVGRLTRAGQLDTAELYSTALVVLIQELRRRRE